MLRCRRCRRVIGPIEAASLAGTRVRVPPRRDLCHSACLELTEGVRRPRGTDRGRLLGSTQPSMKLVLCLLRGGCSTHARIAQRCRRVALRCRRHGSGLLTCILQSRGTMHLGNCEPPLHLLNCLRRCLRDRMLLLECAGTLLGCAEGRLPVAHRLGCKASCKAVGHTQVWRGPRLGRRRLLLGCPRVWPAPHGRGCSCSWRRHCCGYGRRRRSSVNLTIAQPEFGGRRGGLSH